MRRNPDKNQKGRQEKKTADAEIARLLDPFFEKIQTPPVDLEWMKLEQRIEMAEAKVVALQTHKRRHAWFFNPALATAMSLIVLVSGFWLYQNQKGIDYRTGRHQWQTVILADSSEVILNCESRIRIKKGFNEKSRQVFLKGEAYFKVQKGCSSFQIITNQGIITVVGTEFNVRSRNSEMEVAVNNGIVTVQSEAEAGDPVILTQGQMTRIALGTPPEAPSEVQFDQYPGWLHGTLTVNRMDLIDLTAEIERRFDVDVVVHDPAVQHVQITGLFEAAEAQPVLESLCVLVQKELRQHNGQWIIE